MIRKRYITESQIILTHFVIYKYTRLGFLVLEVDL